jgi:hypothetical protein
MKTQAWPSIGVALFGAAVVASPLFVPGTARAETRKTRSVTSANQSAICTTAGCSTGIGTDEPSVMDRKLGTAITWNPTPDAAWRAAKDDGKLVFMIQVSGNFARQEFT